MYSDFEREKVKQQKPPFPYPILRKKKDLSGKCKWSRTIDVCVG
jgi:hypothetical protein